MGVWDKPLPVGLSSGNVWTSLEGDLQHRGAPVTGPGIWALISNEPGGLWDQAQDETMVLRPKGADIWQAANDETMVLPRPQKSSVWQAAEDQTDKTEILGKPSKDLWGNVQQETLVLGRPSANVWNQPKIRDMAGYKPNRALGWALKKLETAQGEHYYILKNLRQGTYLRLNEQQAYQWNLMDGSHSVQDIVVSCFLTFQTLSIDSLMGFLDQLQSKGFLVSKSVNAYQSASLQLEHRSLAYWGRRLVMLLVDSELSIKNVDPFYTAFYRVFGWILYTLPVQILILLVSLAGVPAFFYITTHGDLSVLTGAGSTVGVGLVCLIIAEIFSIFSHESAHALTVKRYKRQVRRGGMGLYFGMPTFFMDTTDIWMEPRRPRLAVTWAGPYSGFFLGGLASLLLLISRTSIWSGIAYQFATFCYLISFTNLNPLLKLDGYYLLMDWLEMPMLRERSMAFVQSKLWTKLRTRQKFTHDERIFAVFGVLAILWTAIAIFSMVQLYGGAVFGFIAKFVGTLATWIILIVLLGTAAGLFLRSWWMARSRAIPTENAAN